VFIRKLKSDLTKSVKLVRQQLFQIAIVVRDYDEAIAFYTQKLGFILLEDSILSPEKRWVRVAPSGYKTGDCCFLLAKAANKRQMDAVGNQTGGRVFLFLYTDDFERDYERLLANNIKIVGGRREESYGTVAVFEDLYGNLWDLIQPNVI
jgi:catechol 2,3-dioxygenase-like lactoylglutathione lyase family enzyme